MPPPEACPANWRTRSMPSLPSISVITRARARSGLSTGDAVHLGDGLREQRGGLEEPGRLDAGEREGDARADAGDHRRRADGRAAGGDGGEVAALEDAHDLLGRRVRDAAADARAGAPRRRAAGSTAPRRCRARRRGRVPRPAVAPRAPAPGGAARVGARRPSARTAALARGVAAHRGDLVHAIAMVATILSAMAVRTPEPAEARVGARMRYASRCRSVRYFTVPWSAL